ncbi:MAG TPA: hypothetical protein VHB79_33000 [Polyangiaceae bacterium]|nr:hypothetical protein [Polyangiaceae bacterium]
MRATLLVASCGALGNAMGCGFPNYDVERVELLPNGGQAGQGATQNGDAGKGADSSGGTLASTGGGGSAGSDAGGSVAAGGGGTTGATGDGGEAGALALAGASGAGGADSGGPLLFDDFEDGVDDGWFATSGDWGVVTSNNSKVYQVKNLLDQSLFSVIGDLSWTDVAVEVKVRALEFGGSSSADLIGVYARFDSPANHYYVALRGDGKLAIRKKVDINSTLGTPVIFAAAVGKQFKVRFEVQGDELRAYVDDVLMLTTHDSDLKTGRIAIGTDNARAEFDDVTVTAL